MRLIASHLEYPGLWLMSLLYLTFDFYPQVSDLAAIWSTLAFWILWIVFSFLDTIAFSILSGKSHDLILGVVPETTVATAAIQFLSTIGVYAILQSLSLQFAGKKVVDVEELVTRFRTSALQAAASKRASMERGRARALAARLRRVYGTDIQSLSEDYSQVMLLANMPRDRIIANLEKQRDSDGFERDTLTNELIMRMTVADPAGVQEIIRIRRSS